MNGSGAKVSLYCKDKETNAAPLLFSRVFERPGPEATVHYKWLCNLAMLGVLLLRRLLLRRLLLLLLRRLLLLLLLRRLLLLLLRVCGYLLHKLALPLVPLVGAVEHCLARGCVNDLPTVMCFMSSVTRHTSHVTRHTSHVTRHTSHVTRHTSHVTRHTSRVTRHTSLVTRHTSHVTRHILGGSTMRCSLHSPPLQCS